MNSSEAQLEDRLASHISTELSLEPDVVVEPDTDLFDEGVLDSLGVVELVTWIEHEHGRSIPQKDVTLANFSTVAAIAAYLRGDR